MAESFKAIDLSVKEPEEPKRPPQKEQAELTDIEVIFNDDSDSLIDYETKKADEPFRMTVTCTFHLLGPDGFIEIKRSRFFRYKDKIATITKAEVQEVIDNMRSEISTEYLGGAEVKGESTSWTDAFLNLFKVR